MLSPARRSLLAALAVTGLALSVRVGCVLREGPPAPLTGDAAQYRAYADSLAATGRFSGPDGDRATRMPGYPLFLAALETAFGPSPRAVQWAQCLLGALTCLFILLWAGTVLRPPWALACGLAAACYYDLAAPSAWTLTECLYSFLLAASFCALSAPRLPVPARAVLGGAGLGLTCLVRPEILPFALALLGLSQFTLRDFTRRCAVLAVAAFLAVAGTWVVRNALVFGRFVPVSSIGHYSRYLGLRLPLEHQPLELGPQHRAPEGLDELRRDADYLAAFRELRDRVPFARRVKAYVFNFLTVYYPFLPDYDWTYGLLVPFWLFGLRLAPGRRELWPAAAIVVGLSLVFAFLAGPVSRYRFGFSPCLLLLAGAGAQELGERCRGARAFPLAVAGWGAANLAVWLGGDSLRQAVLWLKAAALR